MKPELDALLCERYPRIFADREQPTTQSCMGWGFSCSDGWFTLIDALCATLQDLTDRHAGPQVVAAQVKEKWGVLCFYPKLVASEAQWGAIRMAEAMSAHICEQCGQPGRLVVAGAHMTRCPEHTPPDAMPRAEFEAIRKVGRR